MTKTRIVPVFILMTAFLAAEETSSIPDIREVPPPPVVSALSAAVTGSNVELSWTPAEGIGGESIILRSDRPITASSAASSERRGMTPAEKNSFTDTLDSGKEYYYAVLSRDASGTEFNFFIPASNALLVPVSSAAKTPVAEKARISDFGTIRKDDGVIITWKASTRNKNLLLYRSPSPFTGIASLSQAVVVASGANVAAPLTDYPVPGISWYYALLDEDALGSAEIAFTPGTDTSAAPIEIPSAFAKIKRSNLAALRPMPLPWLNPSRQLELQPARFSVTTEQAITALMRTEPPKRHIVREPYLFKSDTSSVSAGEEVALRKVLEGSFKRGDWNKATAELNEFLGIRRSSATTARARFYLGEANYFSGNYRQSILEFLIAEDQYYNQSREWIQYALVEIIKS